MIAYLEKALNLRRAELAPASLLFLYLFMSIGSYIMGKSVAKALFLKAFSAAYLPYGIIATAVVIGVFVSLYIRLSPRLRLQRLVIGSLLFFALSFALFWWLTSRLGTRVYPLVYVWVYTAGAMTPMMGWTLANYVLTTREARRVFGFIGAGAILGGMVAGFATAAAARLVRTETLLLFVASANVISALLVRLLFLHMRGKRSPQELAPADTAGTPRNFRQSWALIRRSRYLTLVTALVAIGCAATTIIEFQFSVIANSAFKSKEALTGFFGKFDGFMGAASLLLQLGLTGRLLRSVGIRVTLLVLPVALMGGSALVLALPSLLTVGVLKGSHHVLRYSLDRSSAELLYLPVPAGIKNQIKSFIDTFIWRVADGVAGLVLLNVVNLMKFSPARISLVNFVFLSVWIATAHGVRREYLNTLRQAIERRTLDPERTAAAELDSTTTEVLASALARSDEQQVLYSLSLFELGRQPSRHPVLRSLLEHPSAAVRRRALRLLSDAGDRQILARAEQMLSDDSPEVRAEVLHYLVMHTGRDPITFLAAESRLPDYALQGSVVAYLERTGKPENFGTAELIFETMLSRTDPEAVHSRAEAARVLGVIPPPCRLHAHLTALLKDADPEVAEHAILSAGKIQGREFLPAVIEALENPRLRVAARLALVQYGERAIGTLHDYLNDSAVLLAVRKQIPPVLSRIPIPESAAALADSMIQSDPGLRFDVLKALNKLRRADPDLVAPSPEFDNMLQAELMGYYRSFQMIAAFELQPGDGPRPANGESVLHRALRERMEYEMERIFRLLGLLYPPRDVHNAFIGLTSGRPQLQANALEVLEHLLRPDLYRMLAYVLDPEIGLRQKLAFAQRICHTTVDSRREALRMLLHSDDRWLIACALHEVGTRRLGEMSDDLQRMSRNNDPLLNETWKWACSRLSLRAAL